MLISESAWEEMTCLFAPSKGKLPVIEITDPQSVSGRAGEYWVYLPAWNNGLKLAYESRPKEIRDGWLMWLGLGEPR
ncbi:Cox family DNA-binding protein [Escherichia coli]|uniref:Cox family DNA-binding protein n=1 Tax=Escherichia coli TaxID=562 RepID=UPI003F80531F